MSDTPLFHYLKVYSSELTIPQVEMSSTHSHSNYDLLQQVMNTPEGEALEFHIRGVVTNWVGNVLPGRFASRYDDPEFMRNVLHLVLSRRQPIQPMGWPTQEPSASLEQWRDEDNSYVPGWLPHGPQDGAGTASDPRVDRVRDVIDGVGRVGIDEATLEPTAAEPSSDPEPLQYVERMQNFHIDTTDRGSSSGAPSDRSSLHSRRKPCTVRHAGKYACKMLGCKKYGKPQLYSRLRYLPHP